MPSNSSNPMNFVRTNSNITASRTGNNWKAPSGGTPTAKLITVGQYRPDHNKQYNVGYYGTPNTSDLADANAFRARPMKHYRKQYGNTNNKQTYNRSNMVNAFERPGGTIMKSSAYDNCTSNNFNGSVLVPDYAIKEANQFNKVGRAVSAPTSVLANIDTTGANVNQTMEFYNYNTCSTVCDPASAARKRVQSQSNVNANPARPKYFQTTKSYLQSRCRTHQQKQTIGKKAGEVYNNANYINNSVVFSSTSCSSTNSCNDGIYKPNNTQYSTQGAVSASSRLARLKLNTIQKADTKTAQTAVNLGPAHQNAYAYSGRAEAPFNAKSKYQSPQFYKNFHISRKGGQGNHTTACFTCTGENRITELIQQSKSIRTSGVGARTLNGNV